MYLPVNYRTNKSKNLIVVNNLGIEHSLTLKSLSRSALLHPYVALFEQTKLQKGEGTVRSVSKHLGMNNICDFDGQRSPFRLEKLFPENACPQFFLFPVKDLYKFMF